MLKILLSRTFVKMAAFALYLSFQYGVLEMIKLPVWHNYAFMQIIQSQTME
jgi:hypothetical protein